MSTAFANVLIEVTEAQSAEVHQAILTAATYSGFGNSDLVLYETTRLLGALSHLKSVVQNFHNMKVAVVDVWKCEAFAYLLERVEATPGIIKFKTIHFCSIETEGESFDNSMLKNFAKKLLNGQKVDAVVVANGEYDDACRNIFENPVFYDSEERRGTLLKAIALYHMDSEGVNGDVYLDIAPSMENSLKFVAGEQKHLVAECFTELPIEFEKEITVETPIKTLQVKI